GVGTAAPAGPEPAPLRGRGRRVEPHVVPLRRDRRTGRAAVDARRCHSGHEPAVEPPVPAVHGPVAPLEIQLHAIDPASRAARWLAEIGPGLTAAGRYRSSWPTGRHRPWSGRSR